jgi:hypothetical protein
MQCFSLGDQSGAAVREVQPRYVACSEDWRTVYVLSEREDGAFVLDIGSIGGEMEHLSLSRLAQQENGAIVADVEAHPGIRGLVLQDSPPAPSFIDGHDGKSTTLFFGDVDDFSFLCCDDGCLSVQHHTAPLARSRLILLQEVADGLLARFYAAVIRARDKNDPSELLKIDLWRSFRRMHSIVASEPRASDTFVQVPRTILTSLERLKRAYDGETRRLEDGSLRGNLIFLRRLHLLLRGLLAADGIEVEPLPIR